jgi:hypothetical protein
MDNKTPDGRHHLHVVELNDDQVGALLRKVGAETIAAARIKSVKMSPYNSDIAIATERTSPRLLTSINPERREYILRILRKLIPLVARERRAIIKKNAQYARLCILDAFQGRLSNGLANNSKKSKLIYTIFCIQTSDLLFKAVVFASAIHTLSIFIEPTDTCLNSMLFKIYQSIVMLIYAVDIALKMGYEGPQVSNQSTFCHILPEAYLYAFDYLYRNIFIIVGNKSTYST